MDIIPPYGVLYRFGITTMGKRYREKEGREEMRASIEVGLTSFNDILQFNNVPLAYPSYEQKKNRKGVATESINVDCRGQDIPKKQTWDKFLETRGYNNKDLISLSNSTDRLADEFYLFMVNDYTTAFKTGSDRYCNLDLEGKTWLRKVCRLAIRDHLMRNKLTGYIQSGSDNENDEDDKDYFCSEYALGLYTLIRLGVKVWLNSTIRSIQHLVKEPERSEDIIQGIVKGIGKEIHQWPLPQQDNILRIVKASQEDQDNDGSKAAAL